MWAPVSASFEPATGTVTPAGARRRGGPRRRPIPNIVTMRGVPERPDGQAYRSDLLTADKEGNRLAALDELPLDEVRTHGQVARRTVRHFRFDYGYQSWRSTPNRSARTVWVHSLRR